jgi:hypothetical protein
MAKLQKNKKTGFPKMQLNLTSQFQELLVLNIKHDYFSSGEFPKLKLRPAEGTTEALQGNGLQCRFLSSGLMLGYIYSDTFTPIKAISAPVKLSFFLEIEDANFMNYTDLPFEFEEDKIFYFHNKELEKESTENKNMSTDQYVSAEDKIEISSSIINYSFEDEQYGTEVQVVDASEEVVYEQILEDGAVSCEISLLGVPEGKYSILIDGLEEKTFFLYNGLKSVFGAVDIIIDKDDFGDYAFFEDNGDLIRQQYNIHFAARQLRWQYMLIETGLEQMHDDHEAYDSGKGKSYTPIIFQDAEEAQLESGKTIHLIWSEDTILFKQKQNQKFKLKTKRGKSGVEWILDLPCASALNNLKVNLNDKSEVYSEIIVYL